MVQEPKIGEHISKDFSFNFRDPDGNTHRAQIERNALDPNDWRVIVDDVQLQDPGIACDQLLLCQKDVNGDTEIGGDRYHCHVLMAASDGAFLMGNHRYCPYFLNPPGIWINL